MWSENICIPPVATIPSSLGVDVTLSEMFVFDTNTPNVIHAYRLEYIWFWSRDGKKPAQFCLQCILPKKSRESRAKISQIPITPAQIIRSVNPDKNPSFLCEEPWTRTKMWKSL